MSTTSTVPTVKAQLVTVYTAALANAGPGQVQVSYAWSGADTEPLAVFLGRRTDLFDITPTARAEAAIATIKAGRKQRQETYDLEASIWSWRPDLAPDDPAIAEAQSFAVLGLIEDVHANDPRIGLSPSVVQRTEITALDIALFPYQSGWASVLVPTITVNARLN